MTTQRQGYALARAELIHALTAYTGITTADGTPTTLIDSNLIGRNDFVTAKTILLMSGDAINEDRAAISFNPAAPGTITVASAFTNAAGAPSPVVAGTIFRILNISTVELDVVNILTRIGTNTDPAGTTTVFARLRQVVDTYLADGTVGLAALKTLIDAVEGKLDGASGLAAIKAVVDAILAAVVTEVADILADTNELQTDWVDGGRLDLLLDAVKAQTDKIAGKMLFSMDFWSNPQEEVAVTDAQTTPTLPSVTIADLPATATIVRAIAMFKFRMVENTNAAENSLDCAAVQPIQVDDSGATGYVTAIDFVDEMYKIAAGPLREGGDVIIGDNDIAARVDGNDTYSFRWLNAKAHLANLQFNDVQCGLRIWYSV